MYISLEREAADLIVLTRFRAIYSSVRSSVLLTYIFHAFSEKTDSKIQKSDTTAVVQSGHTLSCLDLFR